ncbi:MAG: hypothetical protein GY711_26985 [bacterium]|nr:hypothetical protein [bacterium]
MRDTSLRAACLTAAIVTFVHAGGETASGQTLYANFRERTPSTAPYALVQYGVEADNDLMGHGPNGLNAGFVRIMLTDVPDPSNTNCPMLSCYRYGLPHEYSQARRVRDRVAEVASNLAIGRVGGDVDDVCMPHRALYSELVLVQVRPTAALAPPEIEQARVSLLGLGLGP